MNQKDDKAGKAAKLRWRAEELAQGEALPSPENREFLSPQDMRRAIHELRVHQIELEMQNTELQRTQEELDAVRARYFDLYNLAPVAYFVLSPEGLFLETNFTALTLLGAVRSTLIKQPVTRFIFKEDQDLYYLHRRQFLKTGEPYGCDLRMVKADGTTFWAHLSATATQDPSLSSGQATEGAPVSRMVLSDITELKRVEEAMKRSEALLNTTQQLTRVGSWEWDARTQTTYWSEGTYRLHDLRPGRPVVGPEQIARNLDCYLPEDRPVILAARQRCMEQGEPYDLEFLFTSVKGRQFWIRSFAEPVMENGELVRVTGFIMDITDCQSRGRAVQGRPKIRRGTSAAPREKLA